MSLLPVVPAARGDFSLVVAGGTSLVLSDLLGAWDGESNVVLRVTANVGATDTTIPAIDFDEPGTFRLVVPSGVRVSGAGGNGGISSTGPALRNGGDGGDALHVAAGVALTIENAGTIAGGGGGGGGGGGQAGGGGAGSPVGTAGTSPPGAEDGTATTGGAASGVGAGAGGDLGQPGADAPGSLTTDGDGGAAGRWVVNSGTVIQTGGGSYLGTTSGL